MRGNRFGAWRAVAAVGRWLDQVILVHLYRHQRARRRSSREREERDRRFEEETNELLPRAAALSDEDIGGFEERERLRLEAIEQKARTNLVSISLAIAAATALLGITSRTPPAPAASPPPVVVWWAYVVVLVGWTYLVACGYFAFETLNVRQVYNVSPGESAQLSARRLRARRLFYLEQNQSVTLVMTNALAVSFGAIRNGILMLAVGFVMILVHSLL